MADEDPKYKEADWKMGRAADNALDAIYDIVRDLPVDQQKKLIEEWFGDDFYDAYIEWLEDE